MEEEIKVKFHKTIDILEGLEELMEQDATPEVREILETTWLKIMDTFPVEFREATQLDCSAEGLRRYLRIRSLFYDSPEIPATFLDLQLYCLSCELENEDDED